MLWPLKHKVPPLYSRADLPIHVKTGREWGPDCARSLTSVGMTRLKDTAQISQARASLPHHAKTARVGDPQPAVHDH